MTTFMFKIQKMTQNNLYSELLKVRIVTWGNVHRVIEGKIAVKPVLRIKFLFSVFNIVNI